MRPWQVVWARYAGMMLVVAVILAPRLGPLLRTRHLGMQLLRSAFLFAATFCFFTAISHMPIAAATAVMQVHPMILTLGAALLLKEALGPRRLLGGGGRADRRADRDPARRRGLPPGPRVMPLLAGVFLCLLRADHGAFWAATSRS